MEQLKDVQFTKYIPFADSANGDVDFGSSSIVTCGGSITAAGGVIGGVILGCGGNISAGGDIQSCGTISAASGAIGGVNLSDGIVSAQCGIEASFGLFSVASDGSISAANFNASASGVLIGDKTYFPMDVMVDGHSGFILMTE